MPTKDKYLQGQLLLDGGMLRGSFFHRTVVLICMHNAEGAFGLVLNRTTGNHAGEVIMADLPDRLREESVFLGGPVQPGALSFLHSNSDLPDGNVMPRLALGHALEELVSIASTPSPSTQLRMFAGYAGWSPGQLEDEMKRKAWLTHTASLDLIFHPTPEILWKEILRLKGWKYQLLAESPEDPSQN